MTRLFSLAIRLTPRAQILSQDYHSHLLQPFERGVHAVHAFSTSFIKQNTSWRGCDRAEESDLSTDDGEHGKPTRASSKETLGSHVTCSSTLLEPGRKIKTRIMSANQSWMKRTRRGKNERFGWVLSPQTFVELAPRPASAWV